MSVATKKVNGVDKVDVSLNKGDAVLKFTPQSTAKYGDVRSAIEKNGFVVRDAQITVRGNLRKTPGGLQFVVSGSGETFNVSPHNNNTELAHALEARDGQDVTLDATVPAPEKGHNQDKMIVKSILK